MKKIATKINMALVAVLASTPAMAAVDNGLCEMLIRMHDVFNTLRILAFVGAAFVVAGWAWGYIKDGKFDMDDLRKKGTGMLVGFVLLFAIGVALSFFMSQAGLSSLGCATSIIKNW